MKIDAVLAVELSLLTQALDVPGADVARSLSRLADHACAAVGSYVGLRVAIAHGGSQCDLTVLQEGLEASQAQTSLIVPLPAMIADEMANTSSVVLILYAGVPGAFVDLAADLAWMTGREPSEFGLDGRQNPSDNVTNLTSISGISAVNQALGVLIGRGLTPERAERELYARAADDKIDLPAAAALIIDTLTPTRAEPHSP